MPPMHVELLGSWCLFCDVPRSVTLGRQLLRTELRRHRSSSDTIQRSDLSISDSRLRQSIIYSTLNPSITIPLVTPDCSIVSPGMDAEVQTVVSDDQHQPRISTNHCRESMSTPPIAERQGIVVLRKVTSIIVRSQLHCFTTLQYPFNVPIAMRQCDQKG